jgi:hypothetical protein
MDKTRAQLVLAQIDAILRWEQQTDQHKDQKFAELGKHLCEVRKRGTGGWDTKASKRIWRRSFRTPGGRPIT